jgi:hypothetical protein
MWVNLDIYMFQARGGLEVRLSGEVVVVIGDVTCRCRTSSSTWMVCPAGGGGPEVGDDINHAITLFSDSGWKPGQTRPRT